MNTAKLKKKIAPVLKTYRVKRAGVFGSTARGESKAKSDIDLLVELGPKTSLLDFVRLKLQLEQTLGRRVDLVEYQALRPRLKTRILKEQVRLV